MLSRSPFYLVKTWLMISKSTGLINEKKKNIDIMRLPSCSTRTDATDNIQEGERIGDSIIGQRLM